MLRLPAPSRDVWLPCLIAILVVVALAVAGIVDGQFVVLLAFITYCLGNGLGYSRGLTEGRKIKEDALVAVYGSDWQETLAKKYVQERAGRTARWN